MNRLEFLQKTALTTLVIALSPTLLASNSKKCDYNYVMYVLKTGGTIKNKSLYITKPIIIDFDCKGATISDSEIYFDFKKGDCMTFCEGTMNCTMVDNTITINTDGVVFCY